MVQIVKKHLEIFLVAAIILAAISYRWLLIKDNHIYFWFDQARDAYYARNILESRDFKIQGPSASGTNDSVYHGVLYYYFIAPFYTLANGHPLAPSLTLIFWNSLAIIPLYILSKDITQSKLASLLVCLLFAFSFENSTFSVWLSNPALAILPITVFYLSLWRLFVKNDKKFLVLLALCLGLSIQSAIWLVYLAIPLILCFINFVLIKKAAHLKIKDYVIFVSVFLVSIASMLLTQYKLWRAEIFSPQIILADFEQKAINLVQLGEKVFQLLATKWTASLLPNYSYAGLFIALLLLLFLLVSKIKKQAKFLILLILLAPLTLVLSNPRSTYHFFLNTEIGFYLIIGLWLNQLKHQRKKEIVAAIIVIFFFIINTKALFTLRSNQDSNLYIQKGAVLKDQIQTIKTTYNLSKNQKFSISTYGNPLYYAITWAYLYDWWADDHDLLKPELVGASQEGKVGAGLLKEIDEPLNIHFTIIEPEFDASPIFKQMFLEEQNSYSQIEQQFNFHGIELQHRTTDLDQTKS
jgi:hypothetical protein